MSNFEIGRSIMQNNKNVTKNTIKPNY